VGFGFSFSFLVFGVYFTFFSVYEDWYESWRGLSLSLPVAASESTLSSRQ